MKLIFFIHKKTKIKKSLKTPKNQLKNPTISNNLKNSKIQKDL